MFCWKTKVDKDSNFYTDFGRMKIRITCGRTISIQLYEQEMDKWEEIERERRVKRLSVYTLLSRCLTIKQSQEKRTVAQGLHDNAILV